MFGRATITLGIGPHSSYTNISQQKYTNFTVIKSSTKRLIQCCYLVLSMQEIDNVKRLQEEMRRTILDANNQIASVPRSIDRRIATCWFTAK